MGKIRSGIFMGKLENAFFIEEDLGKIEKLELLGAGVREGDVLKLPLLEAAYFEGKGFLSCGKGVEDLIGVLLEKDSLAKEKFEVLKYLRDRGYILRLGPQDEGGVSEFMRIYRKGIRIGEDRTESVLKVLKEGENPELVMDLEKAGSMRKSLVYAFVGSAGEGGKKSGQGNGGAEILFVKAYRVGYD
jgi:tRNA splicing endonuclease